MRERIYLVCDSRHVVKMSKRRPTLYQGEVAFMVRVNVPDQWFNRSLPQVSLDVPLPDSPDAPVTIILESTDDGEGDGDDA